MVDKNKDLTRLERVWLALGLFIFRVEGLPIERPIKSSKAKTAPSFKHALPK